jgi:predicted transposase YbfD/YdcC
VLSLYHTFEHLTDGRHARGIRYSVALVLTLLVLGKVTGMTTLTAIAEWVRWRAEWLRQVLPGAREQFPCVATYSNVLRAVDAEQITQLLASWLTRLEAVRRCDTEPSRLLSQPEAREQHAQIALDGKTLRGTLAHAAPDQPRQHVVALYETQTGIVLAQQAVPDKGNEITVEATLLTPAQVQGRIVTADAMHTQRACCADIHRFGGAYVLLAKANQPTLEEDLRLFFSEPPPDCRDWRQAHTWSKGHGRLERRELVASTELNEWLAATWPGVAQVFWVQRTRVRQGHSHTQSVYGITNFSPTQAAASRLLEVVQRHWRIENRLHWRRDVTLGEDHCQVRKGTAPLVLAALNNLVLALFDFLGVTNVPQQMRRLDAQPERAIRLVLGSLLTFK